MDRKRRERRRGKAVEKKPKTSNETGRKRGRIKEEREIEDTRKKLMRKYEAERMRK